VLFARTKKAAQTHAKALGEESRPHTTSQAFEGAPRHTGRGDEQTDKARAEARNQRDDLIKRLTAAGQITAAALLRDEARCQLFMRRGLLSHGEASEEPKQE
jgi:hypothetical protein